MLNKLACLAVAAALVTTLCGTYAFASPPSNPCSKTNPPEAPLLFISEPTDKSPTNERLRANMLKLIANAKAGKVAPAERSQTQAAKRKNLSKGTKIAIGVGIVVAVIAVIVIAKSPALNDGQ